MRIMHNEACSVRFLRNLDDCLEEDDIKAKWKRYDKEGIEVAAIRLNKSKNNRRRE